MAVYLKKSAAKTAKSNPDPTYADVMTANSAYNIEDETVYEAVD